MPRGSGGGLLISRKNIFNLLFFFSFLFFFLSFFLLPSFLFFFLSFSFSSSDHPLMPPPNVKVVKWSNVKVVKFRNWSNFETGQKSKWSNPLNGFSGITSMQWPSQGSKKSLTMKFQKKSTFADFNIPPTDPPKDLTRFDREVRMDIFSPPHSSDPLCRPGLDEKW